MQRKENYLPFFLVFFGLCLLLFLAGRIGLFSFFSFLARPASPLREGALGILSSKNLQNKKIEELTKENSDLGKKVLDQSKLDLENKALRDQFQTSVPSTNVLIPSKIVGSPGFIPGFSMPEYLIIDKGQSQGVRMGQAVISGGFLVGRISDVFSDFSKVELVSNKNTSFTAKVQDQKDVTGILKGRGNGEMLLDNVLLTQNIKKGSIVITKGNKDEKGLGYPPDLVVGKLISIDKKASDLFQRGAVKSDVNFSTLTEVFILK